VTPAQFAEYWNGAVARGGQAGITEKTNLCIAARETPSADEFKALLDEEWAVMPNDAAPFIASEGGLFPTAEDVDDDYGEIVDIRALLNSFGHVPEEKRAVLIERSAKHLEALAKLGADLGVIRSWSTSKHPHLSRAVIALPHSIGGYFVGRIPRHNDRILAQSIQDAPSSNEESGAYAALCRLMLDCCVWSAPMNPIGIMEQWPGAAARIGMIVGDIGANSFKLELKK